MRRRLSFVVVALLAVSAARADAATYCVDVRTEGCVPRDTAADAFAAARARAASPLAALFDVLVARAELLGSPEGVASNLAFLELDLSDPEFYQHARALERSVDAGVRMLLTEAVAAGELGPCDTGRLARAVRVTFSGSLVVWALEREGSIAARLRDDLELLLRPYRSPPGRPEDPSVTDPGTEPAVDPAPRRPP